MREYGAGVVFRHVPTGDVLLLKARSRWEFPGGGGESRDHGDVWTTARREVAEETGLLLPHRPPETPHFIAFDDRFVYTTFQYDVHRRWTPSLSHEHDEYVWTHPTTALAYYELHPGVRQVLDEMV
jgi:8-oxo-dGTP pyrophosphatase MutT (NUDIX family)